MCLITILEAPKRAEENIVCYKVIELACSDDGKEVAQTPYQYAPIHKNVIKGKKPFIAKNYRGAIVTDKMFEQYKPYFGEIKGRAVHTFATKIDAKAEADTLKVMLGDICRIYKCIIPKGTLYYNGFYEGKKSFASQKIVFKEAV